MVPSRVNSVGMSWSAGRRGSGRRSRSQSGIHFLLTRLSDCPPAPPPALGSRITS